MGPRNAPEGPRSGPGGPKTAQGPARSAPRVPQEAPRAAQIQLPSRLGGQMVPTWRPRAFHKIILDPPRAGFAPSGGRFSYSFFLSESIAKAVLWAKLAQAYAQHRFTSLCNFYMWISTATDSRSRSINPCLDRKIDFSTDRYLVSVSFCVSQPAG